MIYSIYFTEDSFTSVCVDSGDTFHCTFIEGDEDYLPKKEYLEIFKNWLSPGVNQYIALVNQNVFYNLLIVFRMNRCPGLFFIRDNTLHYNTKAKQYTRPIIDHPIVIASSIAKLYLEANEY